MTIKALSTRGVSNRAIADQLGCCEGTVRYHRRRQAAGAVDGRSRQVHLASRFRAAIDHYLEATGEPTPNNTADLHAWLIAEHDYPGSLRSVQRFVSRHYPPPPRRARRRVETPPGAQAQADWAHFPRVWVAGRPRDLVAFHLLLSYSRFAAVIWSERRHLLAWLSVHNAAFQRLGGIPATVRIDNERTAVIRGAGAWGTLHPVYRRYAETVRFHVDPCAPRTPQAKGKVERRIRDTRRGADPYRQHWNDLAELQAWTDTRLLAAAHVRRCPATGTTVHAAWLAEVPRLAPLPELPEPFDLAVTRRVGPDATVAFDGRTYSVPFYLLGQAVEVRGGADCVQVFHGARRVANHPRHTAARVIIDPAHYHGEATATVQPPTPLGRLGRRLEELAALVPERRPLDLYAALAEVAR